MIYQNEAAEMAARLKELNVFTVSITTKSNQVEVAWKPSAGFKGSYHDRLIFIVGWDYEGKKYVNVECQITNPDILKLLNAATE